LDSNTSMPAGFDTTIVFSSETLNEEIKPQIAEFDPDDAFFELGVWLRGLVAFGHICGDLFASEEANAARVTDRRREFRLIHSGLIQAANINNRLRNTDQTNFIPAGFTIASLDVLAAFFRRAVPLADSLASNAEASFGEWSAWNDFVRNSLRNNGLLPRFEDYGRMAGRPALPGRLLSLFEDTKGNLKEYSDVETVINHVGFTLRALNTVGKMLEKDLPLKISLLIFACIYEETKAMVEHINHRLSRMPDQDAALFISLDTASYTASLELKKVFQQELRGIIGLLPPTSVYARIETTYGLLLDSFQQILVELARTAEPNATPFDFFPRFQLKLDQSLILREHLWQVLRANQKCEAEPDGKNIEALRSKLNEFEKKSLRLLHYKDSETFERFAEEIEAARDKKDLVPILHRFGAYLETLFGQVCMRSVLANHPFEGK